MTVHKNEVYYADLSPVKGSEQGGIRPVLVVQNDVGNKVSPTIIVAAITSKKKKMRMPTHVSVVMEEGRLPKNSMVMMEQIRTIDKSRIIRYVGKINSYTAKRVELASLASLGIDAHRICQNYFMT